MAGLELLVKVTALFACVLLSGIPQLASAATRQQDVDALKALSSAWSGNKLKWNSGDPCGMPWTGVSCDPTNVTVTNLALYDANLMGSLPPDIGGLTGLVMLELSNNLGLTGPLPKELGQLSNLTYLSLQNCSFNGQIPNELGNIQSLQLLALNDNELSGHIPPQLGNLSSLFWMDLSYNSIGGSIPVSDSTNSIGLDNLAAIQHFHLNNNNFTGSVPPQLFSLPVVHHVLLTQNQLNGSFPTVSNFSSTLQIIRMDYNMLTGQIPPFTKATNLTDLRLNHNDFSGTLPNFSALQQLNVLDLGNNSFETNSFPTWASQLPAIITLGFSNTNLNGTVPSGIFNSPNLQQLDLSNNKLNGILNFSGSTAQRLGEVDLQNNSISGFSGEPTTPSPVVLKLTNNPICRNSFFVPVGCDMNQSWAHPPTNCAPTDCSHGRKQNPYTCGCALPLELTLLLTAPNFSNLNYTTTSLESDLANQLSLANVAISANQTYVYDMRNVYPGSVLATVWVFPVKGKSELSTDDSNKIILILLHQEIVLPEGPYLLKYAVTPGRSRGHLATGTIIAISVGCTLGVLIIAVSVLLAIYYKRRADKAIMNNPFASWGGGSSEFGAAPKLKGARWFSLAELKAYTNNWSEDNMIGVGGYGNVYRGLLPSGDLVAIKRAKKDSMQGANEFKNEIELLSRVHHRNLVGLLGFCYEGGEQALVYEFMSNGTLEDHLKGRADRPLTWEWRLEIALESARGLSYLHNHASPPIIHRDIKSPNILLNDKLVAKVADFGLSKLAPDEGEKLVHSVNVVGTLGYLDPEYYMTQNLTDKSDVYSFGVVLLELLTARPPIDGGKYVVREFRNALARGGVAALRPLLDPVVAEVPLTDLDQYLRIPLSCVEESSVDRPTVAEIVKQLESLDAVAKPKSGMRAMDIEGGGKKVKFAEDLETDDAGLLANKSSQDSSYRYQKASDPFQYSGAYGMSTTIKPK